MSAVYAAAPIFSAQKVKLLRMPGAQVGAPEHATLLAGRKATSESRQYLTPREPQHSMNTISWNMNWNEDSWRAAMIDEAGTLLSIIDAAQADEDIDEDPVSRKTRLTMGRTARQLALQIIAELRPATAEPKTEDPSLPIRRLVWF